MKKNKWEVQLKGEIEEGDFELSVIRKSNLHGHDSWGWGDENKIILFDTGLGGNDLNPGTKKQIKFAKQVAKILCEGLERLE